MDLKDQSRENIDIVRRGYEGVAKAYREAKDPLQHEIPIIKRFLTVSNNSTILELGCGTGFPIGKALLEAGKNYTGIDLSEKQIELAQEEFPDWKLHFLVAEMLEHVKNSSSGQFTGIVSMFSIRHLPRILHAEIYSEIHRILVSGGLLLIDCTIEPHDGSSDDWTDLGTNLMYWSGYSKEWTMQTLKDLDFKLNSTYEDTKQFFDEEETTLFLLYEKP